MLDDLKKLKDNALTALEDVETSEQLDEWRSRYIGRSGKLPQLMRGIGQLEPELRPKAGRLGNEVKQALEAAYDEAAGAIERAELEARLEDEAIDVTLPGRAATMGRLHPSTQTLREIERIFADLGFQVYRARDVEYDEYNFQLLNFPPDHPARDMQDSFYVDTDGEDGDNPVLLRTHTSPGQIHAMREFAARNPENPPPVRIILPGMCYRYEQITARSEIQFYQVEGLAVGDGISMADLKGTLEYFVRRLFGAERQLRFRASYFPFTEPSAEVDMDCVLCDGAGCRICKYTGWVEILGCGMVHPNVLRNGGYDPKRYTGFAFGMGPERIMMVRHAIEDIRVFWGNDLRFLEQFG